MLLSPSIQAIKHQKIWKCIGFDASNTVTQSYRASKNIDVYNFDVFLMLTRYGYSN